MHIINPKIIMKDTIKMKERYIFIGILSLTLASAIYIAYINNINEYIVCQKKMVNCLGDLMRI